MVESLRGRAARVPDWAWLAAIVTASALVRGWLARGMPAPFVFVDELIYWELARSLAENGTYSIRDVPTSGYSLLYPALLAPVHWVTDALPTAYGLAKALNALVMSLAAVPAWLLARRVAGRSLALLAAALAVALPSLAYTATLVSENLFYPLVLVFAWTLVRVLERPSWGRLGILALALAAAYATRSQALGFVVALLLAPLCLASIGRERRLLRPFAPLYGVVAGLALLVVGAQLARGQSLSALLGAYSVVGEGGYDLGSALRFWLWHVEVLTLYVAVVPVVVLVVLLARGPRLPERLREHLAATVALVLTSTAVVGAFASRFASDRVQDRYLFFCAPLLLVVVLGWIAIGAPRPVVPLAAGSVIGLALVTAFPYTRFIGEPAKSDTFGLIPLWTANQYLLGGSYRATVLVVALALVSLVAFLPATRIVAVPLVLLGLFVVLSRPVWSGPHGVLRSGEGALFQGIRGVERDWLDTRASDEIAVLWTGRADRFTVNMNEFFNARVGQVYYASAPTPGGLGELPITVDATGLVRTADGKTVDDSYALLDGSVTPAGVALARDDLGITLWRLDGPLASLTRVRGLYPGDTWSGSWASWRRLRCTGGDLRVRLHSDPTLFAGRLTRVLASVGGRPVARIAVPPEGSVTLPVPLTPENGTCTVRFSIEPTLVPEDVLPDSTDTRALGVHFDEFVHDEPA